MHAFLEEVISIIALVIAVLTMFPVIKLKFLEKTANWEETDKDK